MMMKPILALLLVGLIFPDTHIWRLYVPMELPDTHFLVWPIAVEWQA